MDGIQKFIALMIIAACVVHLLRIMTRLFRGKSTGCGCSGGQCPKSAQKSTSTPREDLPDSAKDRGI